MSNRFSAGHGIRAALMGGACLFVLASPAVAQSGNNNQVESVTVTGLITSLQQNLDIKRDANGLVDAISAEDMGKFPDVDMAAALQRIPGVTVSQAPSTLGGVTTTTGAATEIAVRGFGPTFNTTLYDGRQVPSGAGQAFDFRVQSTAPFNVLVNYWWDAFPAGPDAPHTAMLLAMITIAERPAPERRAWKALFDHYVFRGQGHPLAHLP